MRQHIDFCESTHLKEVSEGPYSTLLVFHRNGVVMGGVSCPPVTEMLISTIALSHVVTPFEVLVCDDISTRGVGVVKGIKRVVLPPRFKIFPLQHLHILVCCRCDRHSRKWLLVAELSPPVDWRFSGQAGVKKQSHVP